MQHAGAPARHDQAIQALQYPEERKQGECERAPMNERTRGLVSEDGEQRPRDRNRPCKVSLSRGERVRGGRSLQEEQSEEHEDLGPDTSLVRDGVDTEGLEGGEYNKNRRPSVVQRERKVHPKFIGQRLRDMVALHDVIDVCNGRADEESKDESDNVVSSRPDIHVDSVKYSKKRQAPRNAIDDYTLASGEELVDKQTK